MTAENFLWCLIALNGFLIVRSGIHLHRVKKLHAEVDLLLASLKAMKTRIENAASKFVTK